MLKTSIVTLPRKIMPQVSPTVHISGAAFKLNRNNMLVVVVFVVVKVFVLVRKVSLKLATAENQDQSRRNKRFIQENNANKINNI